MTQEVVIFGASGGIGAALVDAFAADPDCRLVHAVARSQDSRKVSAKVQHHQADITDEASIIALVPKLAGANRILVATGMLSDGAALQPEKSLRQQEVASFEQLFAVNTIGPAMVAKHLLPNLPRQGAVLFAALSARVGSIGDNRLGGWHAYRASKAALNMLIRCYAIEMTRRNPEAICVGLHPGTVRTPLSAPFRRNAPESTLQDPVQSAAHLKQVLGQLRPSDSGQCFDWAGKTIPP